MGMNEKIQFKKLCRSDQHALQVVSIVSFYESFIEGANAKDMQEYLQHAFTPHQLAKELQDTNTTFIGIFDGQVLIGYIKLVYFPQVKQLEVKRLYVIEGYQNQGLGKKLLDQAQQIAIQMEYHELIVTVYEKNHAGLRFYQREGFLPYEETIVHLGQQVRTCPILKKEV